MSDYKPYPAYKDSGVEWLEKVPTHWSMSKLRHNLSTSLSYGANEAAESDDPIHPRFIRITDLDDSGGLRTATFKSLTQDVAAPYMLQENDILLARSGATVGKSFIYKRDMGPACYAGYLIRARLDSQKCTSQYFKYCTESDYYWDYIGGSNIQSTIQNVSAEKYMNLWLAAPPVAEQDEIINHLDRETVRIDALVNKKTRFIELLREKRQALITHAVTKGLDPSATMKDSGVEWLGEVPAHWALSRIKYMVNSIGQGWSPECESRPADDGEWGVLKVGCVNGSVFRSFENKTLPFALAPKPELGLRKGDVLVSRANTRELVGSCAVIEQDYPQLMICDKLYRLIADSSLVTPEYLAALISVHGRRDIEVEATGASASMVNIAQSVILNLQIGLPPIDEQTTIISTISASTQQYDALISKTERSIELLKERRSALITAAVTGQIDLREAA